MTGVDMVETTILRCFFFLPVTCIPKVNFSVLKNLRIVNRERAEGNTTTTLDYAVLSRILFSCAIASNLSTVYAQNPHSLCKLRREYCGLLVSHFFLSVEK